MARASRYSPEVRQAVQEFKSSRVEGTRRDTLVFSSPGAHREGCSDPPATGSMGRPETPGRLATSLAKRPQLLCSFGSRDTPRVAGRRASEPADGPVGLGG